MKRLKRAALLTRLIEGLRESESWCGETHVQKATFFLQNLMQVPLEFEFILYKHGPFSFDLRDEITALRADNLLMLERQWPPYGPRIATTNQSKHIQNNYPRTLTKYDKRIVFTAQKLGDKKVIELERLTTALYVTVADPDASPGNRTNELRRLKPHVAREDARDAIEEVDRIIEEAKELIH